MAAAGQWFGGDGQQLGSRQWTTENCRLLRAAGLQDSNRIHTEDVTELYVVAQLATFAVQYILIFEYDIFKLILCVCVPNVEVFRAQL